MAFSGVPGAINPGQFELGEVGSGSPGFADTVNITSVVSPEFYFKDTLKITSTVSGQQSETAGITDTVKINGTIDTSVNGFMDTINIIGEVFVRDGQLLDCVTGPGTNTETGGGGGASQNYVF